MKKYGLILFLCTFASITVGGELESVSYHSVPQLLSSGEIEKVEIYDSGVSDVDAVFTKSDGTVFSVEKTHGLDEDPVFQQSLKDHDIQYVIYDYEFEGKSKKKRLGRSSWFMIMPMVFMFGIPVLLVLVIIKQAKTISKQADVIKVLAEKENEVPPAVPADRE